MGKRGKTRERKGSPRKSRGASSTTSRDRPRSHQIGALRKREKTKPSAWLFGHLLVEAPARQSAAEPRMHRLPQPSPTLRGQGAGQASARRGQARRGEARRGRGKIKRWRPRRRCSPLNSQSAGLLVGWAYPTRPLVTMKPMGRAMRCRFPCCCPVTQEAETARGVHVFAFRSGEWRFAFQAR